MSCRLISFLEQHWYELIRSTIKRSWTNQIFSSAGMLDELSRIWWVHGPCNTSQLSTMTQIFKPLLYKVTSIARTSKRTKQYKLLYKSKWHPTMGDNFSKLPLSKRGTGRERILIVCFFSSWTINSKGAIFLDSTCYCATKLDPPDLLQ